jgi:hypothetical protein
MEEEQESMESAGPGHSVGTRRGIRVGGVESNRITVALARACQKRAGL